MRRNWLRPKWYVLRTGAFEGGSAHPDTMTWSSPAAPDPTCTVCGAPCPNGGFALPVGYMCYTHGEEWHASHPPSRWRRLWWKVDAPIDRFYWWYCERFGERVPAERGRKA